MTINSDTGGSQYSDKLSLLLFLIAYWELFPKCYVHFTSHVLHSPVQNLPGWETLSHYIALYFKMSLSLVLY